MPCRLHKLAHCATDMTLLAATLLVFVTSLSASSASAAEVTIGFYSSCFVPASKAAAMTPRQNNASPLPRQLEQFFSHSVCTNENSTDEHHQSPRWHYMTFPLVNFLIRHTYHVLYRSHLNVLETPCQGDTILNHSCWFYHVRSVFQ